MLEDRQATAVDISGFTLLELLSVCVIMAVAVFTMAPVFSGRADQEHFNQTLETLEEIETALTGRETGLSAGSMPVAGYVPDMGALPGLYDVLGTPDNPLDDQPAGLWTMDPDMDGVDDLVGYTMFIDDYPDEHSIDASGKAQGATAALSLGWRGPYVEMPRDGVLRDDWGHPVVFQPDTPKAGDLTVKSLGADGIAGGSGHNKDIEVIIRKSRYLTDVAGYVSPASFDDHSKVEILLFYAPPDPPYTPEMDKVPQPKIKELKSQSTGVNEDGYFLFENVPVGRERILKITEQVRLQDEDHFSLTFYRFYAMFGASWLDTIELETIYEAPSI